MYYLVCKIQFINVCLPRVALLLRSAALEKHLWGHPNVSASSSIHISLAQSICLLARRVVLFRAPTSWSH